MPHPLLPDSERAYYAALERKHFAAASSVGSVFSAVGSAEELLELTMTQRGTLEGDDRQLLIERGVDSAALLPQCRYLLVATPGRLGLVDASSLPPKTRVRVVRAKPGTPYSLVVDGVPNQPTGLATLIIGPSEDGSHEQLWTAHPGLPSRPDLDDRWPEGTELSVAEAVLALGPALQLQLSGLEIQLPEPGLPANAKLAGSRLFGRSVAFSVKGLPTFEQAPPLGLFREPPLNQQTGQPRSGVWAYKLAVSEDLAQLALALRERYAPESKEAAKRMPQVGEYSVNELGVVETLDVEVLLPPDYHHFLYWQDPDGRHLAKWVHNNLPDEVSWEGGALHPSKDLFCFFDTRKGVERTHCFTPLGYQLLESAPELLVLSALAGAPESVAPAPECVEASPEL